MTSSFTTNISLEKPDNGDYNNTWNVPVNADWDVLDQAIGGTTTISVVGLTSGTIPLTVTQYRSRIIIFSGALSGNLIYRLPANVGGFWYVYNNTTGSRTVTMSSNTGGGTTYVLPQGKTSIVICDGTNVASGFTAPVALADYATAAGTATSATSATSATNATNLITTNYSILQDGAYLYIKNGTTNICRIDSSGNAIFKGNVTAYGSI